MKRSNDFSNVVIAFIIVMAIGLGVWYEHSLWSECLKDHSWFYCLRVLGHG